ncbi:hypothetical protein NQ166_13925 [Microbacterium sp. zg.Y1090]|uniref:hypothetical protein n=1 Tax=Microbacterium TaxID=33882 RepID=UPI00214B121A|nr:MULTISPECIES: hypothetical protein [unclassified Microbacterium]MCR2812244.1 hypothetical protein [Microbacterium sp. zg.Y1084]MCR2819928.1 hypothetical protein [Microbacterium sp. zg.Y1090]MDL5486130.1 hypothetical protein [Microbacterium sp. zg-Y1211]WIM29339.1 hypothetical protein QNO26_05445 [Microbacterium sp. zg-Y1090]
MTTMDAHAVAEGTLGIEFCGEWHRPVPGTTFSVGRDADLTVDTNRYLHRRLLAFDADAGLWWLTNIGQSISVSLATPDGAYQAVLGPGARVPLVFPELAVMFSAGAYTYELGVHNDAASFVVGRDAASDEPEGDGTTTIGAVSLTPSQKLLLVALCEPILRGGMVGSSQLPSSAAAAARLGWPLTTFNRKLDNVCDKLDREGVQGLRGGVGRLATNRRARLVEHAVLSRLVTPQDLDLLEVAAAASEKGTR